MLCRIGYIWWPCAFLSNYMLVDPLLPLVTIWHFCLSNFTLGWPKLSPARLLTPSMHCTLVWGPFHQICGHRAFLRNLTSGWPQLTPAWPSTPAMTYTLIRGSSYQIEWPYSISKQFDLWLTLADPCMTFDPNNALRSGQGFFPPNLVAIGHC